MAKNTKFELVSPSEVFNFIQDDEDLLLIDARPRNAYKKGHLRRSTCVAITPSGRNIEEVAGPGAPTWSNHCWWDRNVLLVVSAETEKAARKDLQRMQGKRPDEIPGRTKWDANAAEEAEASAKRQKVDGEMQKVDAVVAFLLREGLTRNLKIMVSGNTGDSDGYSEFAEAYPSLITKHTKGPLIPRYPAEIIPGLLYLGDWEHARAERKLTDIGITHILTVHVDPLPPGTLPFKRLFCELADEAEADIGQHFESCHAFIDGAKELKKKVLVHCGAGASRSATICAAYLIKERGWKADETVRFMHRLRSKVQPNAGFMTALRAIEKPSEGDDESKESKVPKIQEGGGPEPAPEPQGRDGKPKPARTVLKSSVKADPNGLRLEIQKDGVVISSALLEEQESHVVGRASNSDILLEHASISRQHACITHQGGTNPCVEDLGAAHGTFVDGKRLKPKEKRALEEGSLVQFGGSSRRYYVKGIRANSNLWEGEVDI